MNRVQRREKRIRTKIRAVSDRPRLSVSRSNVHIYAQIIDDAKNLTVASVSSKEVDAKLAKTAQAEAVGELIAKKATEKKVKEVVFDKGSYKYHGRVKALAEGARKGGLSF